MSFSAVTYILAKKYVDKKIGEISILKIKVVNTLPEKGESNTLYFVKIADPEEFNAYEEYIWHESEQKWEKLGAVKVNLENYYTKEEVDARIETAISEYVPILKHSITIGDYVFNGSQDVTIPTYKGKTN